MFKIILGRPLRLLNLSHFCARSQSSCRPGFPFTHAAASRSSSLSKAASVSASVSLSPSCLRTLRHTFLASLLRGLIMAFLAREPPLRSTSKAPRLTPSALKGTWWLRRRAHEAACVVVKDDAVLGGTKHTQRLIERRATNVLMRKIIAGTRATTGTSHLELDVAKLKPECPLLGCRCAALGKIAPVHIN